MPNSVQNFLLQLWEFINRLFGARGKKSYSPPIIRDERTSGFCRLLQLEIDTGYSVGCWRAILQYAPYDLLLTCDRLQRNPTRSSKLSGTSLLPSGTVFTQHPFATHQVAINRVNRYPVDNKIKVECLGLWHLDLVGITGIAGNAGDRFASAVTKALAFDLLENRVDEILWLERIDHHARRLIGNSHNAIGKI